jgi:hypothetical protein
MSIYRVLIVLLAITILGTLFSGCATPESPKAQPTASAIPPYPLPATPTPATTQIPTTTLTTTPPTAPTPLRTPTNTIPPPPDPSKVPTPIGTPNTPTPNPQQIGTPQPSQPSITPLPISKITDKAPQLAEDQKAKLYVLHPDGTYELFLIDYATDSKTYLLPGDVFVDLVPPRALIGHDAPKQPPPFVATLTTTPALYPVSTR